MVTPLKTRVARVASLLNKHRVNYVVVGGEACNIHGLVRGTKDVDILLQKKRENIERALEALKELPYRLAEEIQPEEVLKKPITIIGDDPRVDLLLNAGKIKYEDAQQDQCERVVEGIKIPFAGVESLIRSKDTDRKKDQADVEILEVIRDRMKS